MNSSTPHDTIKFVRARMQDMLEYVHDQIVGTHEDEELSEFLDAMEREIYRALDQHIYGHPLVYGDGSAVKVELRDGNVIHVRWPSHPAKGGDAA